MNVAATQCMSSLILVRSPPAEVQFAGGEGGGTINEGFVERPSHKHLTDLKAVECDGHHTCGPRKTAQNPTAIVSKKLRRSVQVGAIKGVAENQKSKGSYGNSRLRWNFLMGPNGRF
jgi:hypothetical protein